MTHPTHAIGQLMNQQTDHSGVIWITGYSAAGKTTVGRKVEMAFRTKGLRTIFLDGDDLRAIFANRWGYSREERIELAKVYFRLCSHLSSQGFTVVIAAVAMYDEVRVWLHQNISNALEVYLSVPDEIRRERDLKTKNIYTNETRVEDMYDAPRTADLEISNHSGNSADETAQTIVNYFMSSDRKRNSDKGRDAHWNSYYSTSKVPVEASPFAVNTANLIDSQSKILEVGCGNGRDASYFWNNGHFIHAVDPSKAAIDSCKNRYHGDRIQFHCGTLSDVKNRLTNDFDAVYSRFSLHAMTIEEETKFLSDAFQLLSSSGHLFIECRSINDPLARKGDILSPTERIFGHYRRFIILDELLAKLSNIGYRVLTAHESNGLAVFGDDDPVVIRVHARKQ